MAQSLPQLRHQLGRDIHTTAAALLGKGEDKGPMFVALGTGRAVRANAGLADFGQRALDSGPEFFELAPEVLAEP